MNNYRVRVQVISWYEITVQARSHEDAITNAEGLKPAHIQATGVAVEAQTGLADPVSVGLIETP